MREGSGVRRLGWVAFDVVGLAAHVATRAASATSSDERDLLWRAGLRADSRLTGTSSRAAWRAAIAEKMTV